MNRVFTNCNRLMIETGIVLSIIIFTVFMFVIPTYEKTEKKIAIETTGILTPNALSDGVQIIAINVEGERQDLPSLLGNPDWQYEGGKYTWNACRGSNNRIEFNVSFRELEIIFLKNSWCGGAKIYVNDILSDTIDFYAENDTEFSWKINGAAIMGQKQRVILACVVSVGIWMLFIVINSLVRKKVPAESKVEITNRIIWIDILKGMGVLMVIAGHNLSISPISATLIWSVHMPLFFIVTGYTFKKKETFERIKKDAKVLLVPYACGVIILLISNIIYNLFMKIPFGIFEIVIDYLQRGLYGSGGNILSLFEDRIHFHYIGAIWFLCAMFIARVLFNELIKLDEKYIMVTIAGLSYSGVIITNILTAQKGIWLPWSVQTGMTATMFLYVGYVACKESWMNKENWIGKIVCVIIWVIMIICGSRVYMVTNHYPLGAMNFIAAICGTACLAWIAQWVEHHSVLIKATLRYLGGNSIIILIFHLVELNFIPWDNVYSFIFKDSASSAGKILVIILMKVLWSVMFVEIVHKMQSIKGVFVSNITGKAE